MLPHECCQTLRCNYYEKHKHEGNRKNMHPNHQIKKYFTALPKLAEDLQDLPENQQGAEFFARCTELSSNLIFPDYFSLAICVENMNASKNL